MEIVICQNCGNILKTRARTCESCNGLVSRFGSTSLPSFPQSTQALSVEIKPDPQVLERVLVKHVNQTGGPDPEMVNAFLSRVFNIVGAPQMPVQNYAGEDGTSSGNGISPGGNGGHYPGNGGNGSHPVNGGEAPHNGQNGDPSGYAAGGNGQNLANQASPVDPQAQPVEGYSPNPEYDPVQGIGQGLPPEPIPGTIVDYPPPNDQEQKAQNSQNGEGYDGNAANYGGQSVNQATSGNYPTQQSLAADATAFGSNPGGNPTPSEANLSAIPQQGAEDSAQYQNQYQSGGFAAATPAPQPAPYQNDAGTQNLSSAPPATPVAVPQPTPAPSAGFGENLMRDSGADRSPIGAPPPVVSASQDFFADSPPPPVASDAPAAAKPVTYAEEEATPEIKLSAPLEHDDFFASAPSSRRSTEQGPSTKVISAKGAGGFMGGAHDDDDEDGPVKVSAPLGYRKKEQPVDDFGSSSKDAHDDDDEHSSKKKHAHDDHEDHFDDEEHDLPPARRSFSGKSGIRPIEKKSSAPKSKKPNVHHEDEDDDDEASSKARQEHGKINVLGLNLSKVQAGIAVCAVMVLLFVCFQIFSTVLTTMFAGSGQPGGGLFSGGAANNQDNLSGRWRFVAKSGNIMASGTMLLRQQGNRIYGDGQDNSGGYFRFDGTYNGGVLEFTKQYYRAQNPIDKPILYHAQVKPDNDTLFAQGDWSKTYGEGAGWRHQIKTMTGLWEADRTEVGVKEAPGTQIASNVPAQKEPISTLGLKMAAVFVGIAIAIFVFARRFFGPDGWNNQRQKKKYIPSQYIGEHRKEIKELGQSLKAGSVPFGRRLEWQPWLPWEAKDIALPPQARINNPHILLLGAGDKGKSRLIAKMATHDIEANDRAVVLIDSDGELSELVIDWIAAHPNGKEITKRVVIVDPTWPQGSLAYNPLEMPEDGDLQSAASSLVNGFKAIYTEPPGSQTQWNQQTANILRNATLLLMVNKRTLTDLPTLLQENDFRDVLLEGLESKRKEKVEYGTLLETWGQYKRLARTDQWINWVEPILNRTTPMLSDPRIRPILTKDKGDLNLTDIIKKKKILIVRIPQGQLDKNANLLGSLLVTGLKQAALTIATQDRSNERSNPRPVALYLDEFDNFIEKETFDAITSETKHFQIGFVGASKTLQDLPEDFRNQLIINVGSLVSFSLAKKDGDALGPTMFRVDGRKKKHETLQNFFNPINTSPQFELISDEEKLNIDRVVGQKERTFFLYRVGSEAGVFHLKSHDFKDIPENHINRKLIAKMHGLGADKEKKPITSKPA